MLLPVRKKVLIIQVCYINICELSLYLTLNLVALPLWNLVALPLTWSIVALPLIILMKKILLIEWECHLKVRAACYISRTPTDMEHSHTPTYHSPEKDFAY